MAGAEVNEFELIGRYFAHVGAPRDDVECSVGDDGAVLRSSEDGRRLVWATDTLVAGRHFPDGAEPAAIGHKALAVNLSDLAAMGAEPAWATLALTLPEADPDWLAAFAEGFGALARTHNVALVGGDTTRGPLTITVGVAGWSERPLRRDGARAGDGIFVTGRLGEGLAGLRVALGEVAPEAAVAETLLGRYYFPEPRLGQKGGQKGDSPLFSRKKGTVPFLATFLATASAAVDISDGLLADLGHILTASGVGATLEAAALPVSPAATAALGAEAAFDAALHGGDDYELLFTCADPAAAEAAFGAESGLGSDTGSGTGLAVTRIGTIEAAPGLRLVDADGRATTPAVSGHDHFRGGST